MEIKSFLSKLKVILPASLLVITTSAFAQSGDKKPSKSRSEVNYRQLHSSKSNDKDGLYADGIKLKMNLSVLEEAEAERAAFDENEIPADDIYGGVWRNSSVNAYGALRNAPDTFTVDLTNFTMPHEGRLTSNFGRRGSRRYHYGIDLKVNVGDTIYAAFDGKIRVTQFERRGYGYYVVVRHVNGLETVYGHLSKFLVKENDFVRSGQAIGLGGNTGRSTGPHLHFETRFLGKPINPNFIIDIDNNVCHRDEYLVTNSSFRKTSNRSSVYARSGSGDNYQKRSSNNNKFVDGKVKYHRVRKGDTLGKIAQRHGVSVKKLCSLNNITSKTTLRTGKSLRIS